MWSEIDAKAIEFKHKKNHLKATKKSYKKKLIMNYIKLLLNL